MIGLIMHNNPYYIDPNYPYFNEVINLLEGQSIVLPQMIPSGIMDIVLNVAVEQGAKLEITPSNLGIIYYLNKNEN